MADIQIRCVLKTGGSYTAEYVKYLMLSVKKNLNKTYDFVCLTDDPEVTFCDTIALKYNWPGWWSKIELFRNDLPQVPSIYFDLDTIIKGKINSLFMTAMSVDFVALRGFNHKYSAPKKPNFASGIMVGKFYKYTHVYSEFLKKPKKYMDQPRENWMHGDQGFIADTIGLSSILRLQDYVGENFIVGKRIIRKQKKVPDDARIIAWSGKPRFMDMESVDNKSIEIYSQLIKLWRA